jgi:nucleotidyltransferase/DNA polymerase involved in DNA repair
VRERECVRACARVCVCTCEIEVGMASSSDPAALHRVILHLDLDAFYAQVEHKRLNIPREVPLAVQQWQGIIAVNYPARAAGIKRHLNVAEAKKQCPALVLVHVETIGGDDDEENDDADGAAIAIATTATAAAAVATVKQDDRGGGRGGGGGGGNGEGGGGGAGEKRAVENDAATRNENAASTAACAAAAAPAPDRNTRKVSLQRYRRASKEIMAALSGVCPTVERASIDEAYVDITAEVDAALWGRAPEEAAAAGVRASGFVSELDTAGSDLDRRLAIGAEVCLRMREAVFAKTGYTVSGGVAHNKVGGL